VVTSLFSPFKQLKMINKVKEIFNKIQINLIAKETKFMIRTPKKINPYNFLYSFYLMMGNKKISLRNWAIEFEKLTNITISDQAIDKRLQIRHIQFYKSLFENVIRTTYTKYFTRITESLKPFQRVLIEDSTCVKLANKLHEYFSGSTNQVAKSAITRIQFSFDLKSNVYENVEMCTYTHNDGAYSIDIVHRAQRDDLVIRDLGYWSLNVFKRLVKKGVYILSRFKLNVKVYDESKKEIDLVKYLKNLNKKGINKFDINVLIGSKFYLPLRMTGIKLTPKQMEKKIRAAKKNTHKKDKKRKISKETLILMSWNIMVTNVDEQIWSVEDVYKVYSFRWNIEMMFKNWKSTFKIDELLQTTKSKNPFRPEALLYLALTYLAVIFQPSFNYYYNKIKSKYDKYLSPIKFGQFILQNLSNMLNFKENYLLEVLSRHCCYDKRKDRII